MDGQIVTGATLPQEQNRKLRNFVGLARNIRTKLADDPCELGLLDGLDVIPVGSTSGDRFGDEYWGRGAPRIVRPAQRGDPFEDEGFVAGWLICSELEHPAIPRVENVCKDEKGRVLALVNASPQRAAKAVCQDVELSLDARLHWMLMVCEAVAVAHDAGIAHLNLSPFSILEAADGRPLLTGWSDARVLEEYCESERLLQYSRTCPDLDQGVLDAYLRGGVGYLAPEQACGDLRCHFDKRTDVFLLGTLLYELLTGGQLVEAANLEAYVAILGDCRFVAPKESLGRKPIPPELANICMRSLSANPADRYADARTFHDAIASQILISNKRTGIIHRIRSFF